MSTSLVAGLATAEPKKSFLEFCSEPLVNQDLVIFTNGCGKVIDAVMSNDMVTLELYRDESLIYLKNFVQGARDQKMAFLLEGQVRGNLHPTTDLVGSAAALDPGLLSHQLNDTLMIGTNVVERLLSEYDQQSAAGFDLFGTVAAASDVLLALSDPNSGPVMLIAPRLAEVDLATWTWVCAVDPVLGIEIQQRMVAAVAELLAR